ncbi:MAG: hypothetical protein EOO43_26105 [Flavobacterium sp.]|nr:MAG: hypothetical protein EOO43_26105 [Flavobacterium sp.]
MIVGCEDTSVLVIDINNSKINSVFRHVHESEYLLRPHPYFSIEKITSLVLTSDDRYLITGSFEGSVGIIDLEKKEHFHSYENSHLGIYLSDISSLSLIGTITSTFMSNDNTRIMTASHDGIFQIIHLMKKELYGTIENVHKGLVKAIFHSNLNKKTRRS